MPLTAEIASVNLYGTPEVSDVLDHDLSHETHRAMA
jgi:hypothetical protein